MKLTRAAFLAFLAVASGAIGARAMQLSDVPSKFNIPWANSAVAPYVQTIPQASQIGVTNCRASLTDGFPPLTFVPANAGGCPPFGSDFNGILKQVTQWVRWLAAGGPTFYDGTFSTQVGGYPAGATVQSVTMLGRFWVSTADNNATNPDTTSSVGWIPVGTAPAGTLIQTLGGAASRPPNAVPANGQTIGNASSNATSRANADTYWLFVRIWTDCPNAQCPLFNSSGGAVARGGSANADYAANNAIATYLMNGAGTVAADTQGGVTGTNLSGVPVVIGSRTAPGSILGENFHTMSLSELVAHSHAIIWSDPGHFHAMADPANTFQAPTFSGSQDFQAIAGGKALTQTQLLSTGSKVTGITFNSGANTTGSSGSTTAFNQVQRSFLTSNWLAL